MERLTDMPFCQTTSWRRFFSLSDRSKRPKKSSPPARTARHEDGDETNSESACSKARSVNVGLTVASEDGTSPRQLLAHSLRPKEWVVRVVKLKGDRAQVWRSGNYIFEQLPDRFRTGSRMRICIHPGKLRATGNMRLDHPRQVKLLNKVASVEVVISSIGIQVVNVEQDAAAGPRG